MGNCTTEDADTMGAMNEDVTCIWMLGSHAI